MAEPSANARDEARIVRAVTMRLLPLLVLLYTVAYVDRSVVGFAKLQLAADIGLGDTAYGFGAGLFFIGYFLFELPSNILLTRVGARRWFARILVSWGVVTVLMATIRTPRAGARCRSPDCCSRSPMCSARSRSGWCRAGPTARGNGTAM